MGGGSLSEREGPFHHPSFSFTQTLSFPNTDLATTAASVAASTARRGGIGVGGAGARGVGGGGAARVGVWVVEGRIVCERVCSAGERRECDARGEFVEIADLQIAPRAWAVVGGAHTLTARALPSITPATHMRVHVLVDAALEATCPTLVVDATDPGATTVGDLKRKVRGGWAEGHRKGSKKKRTSACL